MKSSRRDYAVVQIIGEFWEVYWTECVGGTSSRSCVLGIINIKLVLIKI